MAETGPTDSPRGKETAPPVCSPEVYTSPPPQPNERKPGQLSPEQVRQFFEEGYLLVKDYFTPEELQPVREAVEELVDDLAQRMRRAGKITDTHKDVGLFQRLTLLNKEYPGAAVVLHKKGKLPQAFRDLWSHERLLNVMEQFIGPEIAGHPIWNLRTKTPRNEEVTVPWHQDNAYLGVQSLGTLQPTAWIPLLDANKDNGCMQVVRGGHRKGITARHLCCVGGTWYVELPEDEIENTLGCDLKNDIVTCEVPYGGVLFLNNAIPHRSLENNTDQIRWSLDLRWQHPDKPCGFEGIKDVIPMRSAKNPDLKPDWEKFESVDRTANQQRKMNNESGAEDEFDTTIQGPWMLRWEIVNHNKHTRSLLGEDKGKNPIWTKA
ncbi:Hypp506 [Branchiostoma lanceolatum]|uniref:Hypp506 protein n=1 Tax=Branchiostoma lanceolatum TaxID=7740 RepID=A0A8J9YL96_BRALA|nr:Hypp506 [Branchiostoma lanceolatum]